LQQQVAQQDSPPWLAQRAHQLGMVPAPDAAHLVVGANGKVTVVGTPAAATPPPKPKPPATPKPPTNPPPSGSSSTTSTPPTGG
jgi:hypothetical protein